MRHLLGLPLMVLLVSIATPAFAAPSNTTGAKTAAAKSTERQMPLISTQQLKAKLDKHENVTLVEALEPEYYAKGHLPNAIQMVDAAKFAKKLLPNKSAEIVVYCMNTHWHASDEVARDLATMGYTNVSVYRAGKQGWKEAGYRLQK